MAISTTSFRTSAGSAALPSSAVPVSSAVTVSSAERGEQEFSVRQARQIVGDLFKPRMKIYWVDYLLSVTIGYAAAAVYFRAPLFSATQLVALLVSGFALFRVGTFLHEIQHMPRGTMRGFKLVYNILSGIPMLMPSFFYDNHADHHRSTSYGTKHDGEYLPLGTGPLGHFFMYSIQGLFLPAIVTFRFTILTPISFLHPRLRRLVLERFSYYGINPYYRRRLPAAGPEWWWAPLDIVCCLRAWGIFAVVLFGTFDWTRIPLLYVLAVVALGLNYIRNVAAHRYRSHGEEMSYTDQLADSINIVGTPVVTELFFPLGLRYHALHHLLPTIPYHNMAAAHRRLMEQLPAGSPYRRTEYPTYMAVVKQLWRDARAERQRHGGELTTAAAEGAR